MLNNNQSIRWSEKLGIFKMTQIYIESIIEMKKISTNDKFGIFNFKVNL
jgi:hypothetical protein